MWKVVFEEVRGSVIGLKIFVDLAEMEGTEIELHIACFGSSEHEYSRGLH